MRGFFTQLFVLFFLALLAFFAGKWQTVYRNQGKIDPITLTVQNIIVPSATTIDQTAEGVSSFFSGMFHAKSLTEENIFLKNKLKMAESQLNQVQILQQKILHLEKLLRFNDYHPRQQKIPANIIGFFPYENRITLSAGSKKGIEPGLAVITPEGLLAIIQTVDETRSQASLLSSPTLQIGAMILKNPPYVGLIKGEGTKTIFMELLDDKVPVKVNDLVFTSEFSEKIPPSIPIGKVIHIEQNPDFGIQKARIFLNATIGKTKEVFIIK